MNLRAIDLNLLIVLDALLNEVHVSRAAERIGLSQPATSNALERCRHLFNDRLLERGAGGMRLTPKALALREPLKQALSAVGAVINLPDVQLATLSQTIRILMADHPAVFVVRELQKRLAETAPLINLVIQPWHGSTAALDDLARGDIDFAISVFPTLGPAYRRKELLQEHYIVAMDLNHPAAQAFSVEKWLSYPHILVSGRGDTHGALDDALAAQGLSRRVGVVVPSFLMANALLRDSELIAMLPSRCLPIDAAQTLALFEPPVLVEGFGLHLAWHSRRDNDLAVQHVIQLIEEILIK